MPISDQTETIHTVKSGGSSKRTRCTIISGVIILLLAGAAASVLNVPGWQFWEKEEEVVPEPEVVEEEPEVTKSWITCGGKSLLEETVTDEFGTKSDPCVLSEGESPFSTMIYRDSGDFK